MKAKCKCEHWQVCPLCYPQGTFDDAGRLIVKSDNPTQIADRLARYGDADAAVELRRLHAENERLRAQMRVLTYDVGRGFSESEIRHQGRNFSDWEAGFLAACNAVDERIRAALGRNE